MTIAPQIISLLESLERNETRVVWRHSYFADYDTNFDVFYSFCEVRGGFISLHGEMNIETFHERRRSNSNVAHLYRSEYEPAPEGLVQVRKDRIGPGADPRFVSDGEQAFAYVIGYGEAGHPAFLYNEQDRSLKPLTAPDHFQWGKNWQPFMDQGRLFIVHELSPFTIYEIDPVKLTLTETHYADSDFSLPAHNTNHTMFRGGANALVEGDYIYGVGRASAQSYKHLPFFWSAPKRGVPSLQFSPFFNDLGRRGFNIIDPTSFFKQGNNYYIGLACSETCWFHKQQFLNLLLVVDQDDSHTTVPTLREVAEEFTEEFQNRKPNLRKHIFHCDRLQHDIPFIREYGVQSMGRPGVLVYGPYVKIESAMRLKVELAYLTLEEQGQTGGAFDINLSRRSSQGKVDFIKVTERVLNTTGKEMQYVDLYIDTSPYLGYLMEFRVFAHANIHLNAFHIRTLEFQGDFPEQVPARKKSIVSMLRDWFKK